MMGLTYYIKIYIVCINKYIYHALESSGKWKFVMDIIVRKGDCQLQNLQQFGNANLVMLSNSKNIMGT